MSKFLKSLVFLVIATGFSIFSYFQWYWSSFGPVFSISNPLEVEVKEGSGLYSSIKKLHKLGVIHNSFLFKLKVNLMSIAPILKPGIYKFEGEYRPKDILDVFLSGKILMIKITIPEGFNLYQIAEKLKTSGLRVQPADWMTELKKQEIFKKIPKEASTLEGYLFPETYDHSAVAKTHHVISRMVEQFFGVVGEDLINKGAKYNLTLHQLVTLASIIEKETGVPTERRHISGVFHNRLRIGMRLQTDPTVVYGLLPNYLGRIRKVDLLTPTPYNTYTNSGLPPGPIASPGLASLEAAADPLETEDLYFVSKGDGSHKFSKTLNEHNAAVRKYQLGKE